jgi:carotenoid cleavage dioxygenase
MFQLDTVRFIPYRNCMTATHTPPASNPYLVGNFTPVHDEVTADDLEVIGDLPTDLNGRYLRNGPNPIAEVDPLTHHWFVGDGMVHGIRLREGRAEWYRNRYVGSSRVSQARGLPEVPGRNWNNSPGGPNTSVGGFAGTTWAMVEAGGCPVELTYELETIGRNDFFGTLPGAFSAHPKVEPVSGEMHAIAYAWAQWLDHVQYVRVGKDGRVNRTVDIALPGMTMIHDMSITEKYVVVYDQPVLVDMNLALTGHTFPFRWSDDYGNRVGLMPMDGGAADIVWIDVPVGYVFHPLNAYDTPDGNVVADLCFFETMFKTDLLGPFGDARAKLIRWELNPGTRTVAVTVIDESTNEFPRHRGSLTGRQHRYGYCAQPDPHSTHWPTLKHDLLTGARELFDHGPGRAAGEPVFVARPDSNTEDDGWLITFVYDGNTDSSEFVVLDAQDFSRGYVARVPLPRRVPFGFHGNWVPDNADAAD